MTQWGLDTLFNPSKRHMDEEKQRLESTREEVGDASGGRRIDFEGGAVVIARTDDEAEPQDEREPSDDDGAGHADGDQGQSGKPLTAAQQRAAARRAGMRAAKRTPPPRPAAGSEPDGGTAPPPNQGPADF